MSTSAFSLLRLLQIVDSSFPVGSFAYSHGLEWLAREHRPGEEELAIWIASSIRQPLSGQYLPAALVARRALGHKGILRADRALDMSLAIETEREAGRAMGERFLVAACDAFGGFLAELMLGSVRAGETPGQYAVAFAAVARDQEIGEGEMLLALGIGNVTTVVQAAVRLGLIGQSAAGRLISRSAPALQTTVESVLGQTGRRRFGSFAPGMELAAVLQPSLKFRMFAS